MWHLQSLTTSPLLLSWCFYLNYILATALVLPPNSDLSQISNTNATDHGYCPFHPSSMVSLPGDTKGKRYTTSSGYDCLNPGNPHRSECWDVLELDEWLPRWFRETPQCPPQSASEVECNIRNPPEPWTTTFMRIATGSGDWNGCSQVGSTNCQYKADSSPHFCGGGKDVQLLEARYNYVAYTITSMFPIPLDKRC